VPRTAEPDRITIQKYRVILTPPADASWRPIDKTYNAGDTMSENIGPGVWYYSIWAFGVDTEHPVAQAENGQIEINAGEIKYIPVILTWNSANTLQGNGIFNPRLNFPGEMRMSDVTESTMSLSKMNSDSVVATSILSEGDNAISLASGVYIGRIIIKDRWQRIGYFTEVVICVPGETTIWEINSTNEIQEGEYGSPIMVVSISPVQAPTLIAPVFEAVRGVTVSYRLAGTAGQYSRIAWFADGILQSTANDSLTFNFSTRGRTPGMNEILVAVTDANGLSSSSSTRLNILPEQQPALSSYAKAITLDTTQIGINNTVPDSEENLYLAAYKNNTAILVKLDSTGEVVWQKMATGTGSSYLNDIALYNSDVYVVGTYTGSLTYDTSSITGTSSIENPFVARFDNNGNLKWIKTTLSGTSYGGWGTIVVGPEGVFTAGMFYGSRDLGSGISVKSNSWAGFDSPWICRYNHDGVPQYAITSTQNRCANVSDISLNDGILVACGYTNGSGNSPFQWGNLSVLNATGYNFNGWVAAFKATSGTPVWNRLAPVGGSSMFDGVCVKEGFVYASGFADPSVYILYEDTNNKSLLVKFDVQNGNVIWSNNNGPTRSRLYKLQADSSGIYAVGYNTDGIRKAVYQKYDANGGLLFTKTALGNADSWYGNIALNNQAVYLAGIQKGTTRYTYTDITEPAYGISPTENGVIVRYMK
jgi:hypothetical protein